MVSSADDSDFNYLNGTWTLVDGQTTTYNNNTYPVYQNGSYYLYMGPTYGKPRITTTIGAEYGWQFWYYGDSPNITHYVAGSEMTPTTLTGRWSNPNEDIDTIITFTYQ